MERPALIAINQPVTLTAMLALFAAPRSNAIVFHISLLPPSARLAAGKVYVFSLKDMLGSIARLVDNAKAAVQGCCGWLSNAGEMGATGE